MTNFQKYKYSYISFAITVMASSVLFLGRKQRLDLLNHNHITSSSYTDEALQGNSISVLTNDNGLKFTYKLGDNYAYAFTGISIDLFEETVENMAKKGPVLNLSNYQSIELTMKVSKGKKIPIQLLSYLEGYSVNGDNNTLVFYEQILDYDPSKKIQSLPLERFAIPNWWRVSHPNLKTEDITMALKNVKALNIQSCSVIPSNVDDKYLISNIQFANQNMYYLIALISGFLMSIFLTMYTFFKQKNMLVVSYSQIALKKTKSPESQSNEVISYINENYSNPTLSAQSLEKQLNVPKNKLSELIKQESNLSFKQYLNSIRVLEAKRLLYETDLSISEIAYQVGYSNVSHFNRVFKNIEGCSPSSYKEDKI